MRPSVLTIRPATRTLPRLGGTKPRTIRRTLVLPEPDGPRRDNTSPSRRDRGTPSRMIPPKSPCLFDRVRAIAPFKWTVSASQLCETMRSAASPVPGSPLTVGRSTPTSVAMLGPLAP